MQPSSHNSHQLFSELVNCRTGTLWSKTGTLVIGPFRFEIDVFLTFDYYNILSGHFESQVFHVMHLAQ